MEKIKEQRSINYAYTRGKKFRTGGNNKGRTACMTLSGMKAINSYLKREIFEIMQRK